MIWETFFDEQLAQASYLVGCPASGEAIVIDPNRDLEPYLRVAAAKELRIVGVMETHIHADFLSGARELAARTGATLYLSDEGDSEWKYSYASETNVSLVRDGDVVEIGGVRLEAVHTPGHTPEHLTWIATEPNVAAMPLGAFTGDFLFVGDVGRPDLLETAAGYEGTMRQSAKRLFTSVLEFKNRFPDTLLIWPGHGSGSACGKSLGGVPMSTLGYEKSANWALRVEDEGEFVDSVLAGQPDPPRYFKEMKRRNKEGPAIEPRALPRRLGVGRVEDSRGEGVLLDVRHEAASAKATIPGAITIPLGESFATWAGTVLSYEEPIALIAEDETQAHEAARVLATIGLDDVLSWYGPELVEGFEDPVRLEIVGVETAREELDKGHWNLLDVRGRDELESDGAVPGALHVPLGLVERERDEIPKSKKLAVICGTGRRSAIACSLLRRLGWNELCSVEGGFEAYREAGLPVREVSATP